MAIAITKYQDNVGNAFETEAEADLSNVKLQFASQIQEFANTHFPAKEGSTRGNPHAGTAAKAISLWIAAQG